MAIRERPLSPHLQVYRWQIQMVTSILNRATGIVLTVGALAIAAALLTLMLGPDHWNCFRDQAATWYGQVFLFGWTWSFAFHLFGGLRHMLQDFGQGYAVRSFISMGWLSVVLSLVLTAAIWAYVLLSGGAV
ncbi:succinate dehydrogenase, cytochrome b556 subunit [Xanthomonas citri pv. glycines]|uniref:Succinate dehydrogenase cytochrome b556 subunit n=4 Tax=Xanthomonas TaxID=338 RepID=A0AA45BV10_XANCM|nr:MULTISPECIES: succinate dehydrogenase, cytochrome b556 subunit [Xanthomonas]OOW65670.1 succinate dehydrogenase [Xanthomonas campestris pv. thespesiae]OOW76887.1 succinate dehydrogenase [Xanthomonas campestris pv. leeana]OOW84013.1 succinate dehydrogenase [Xanthomonas campestris pv. vitiswoodrowii]OOX19788.1 succinate dehydrogenase [Xanthomonas campestris pv. azadirachtae]CEJ43719.1 Succinate dehydrogenase membrane anchor subunit [Xanthomonas citri pv. bilvae]